MTHDPMCKVGIITNKTVTYKFGGCDCPLIARVREDERSKLAEAVSWVQDPEEALDVLTAIAEWDTPPALPASKGVPTRAMWPARGDA